MGSNLCFRTARLILRPFEHRDLDDLFAYLSQPEVCRYLYSYPTATRAEAEENLLRKMAATQIINQGDSLSLGVVLPDSDRVIGDVMLHYSSQIHQQGEIGFVLHPAHKGQGFATEAAGELLRLGFDGLGLHRVIARCDARNLASAHVMERLGMGREAHFVENEFVKNEWTDEFVYALLHTAWHEGHEPSSIDPAPER